MTNLVRVRALQRRPLRIAGTVISTSGDGSVLDLDSPRVAQELRAYQSYPFSKTRLIVTGEAVAGSDAGGHSMPPNKATADILYAKGSLLWNAIELGAGETLSSVTFYSTGTALNTGTHQLVGLYKLGSDGVTLTQVAVSADDTSGAWGANSAKTFTFTTAHKTVGGGIYYVVLLISGTTAPRLVGRTPFSAFITNFDGPATGLYEFETALTGNNNDLRFYSPFSDAQITYTDPGALGVESVLTTGHSVVVTLANDAGPAIISTAATIKATILADAASAAVLTPVLKPGNTGAGVVTAMTIQTVTAQTLPVVAANGDAQTTLPASISAGALSASNQELLFTTA